MFEVSPGMSDIYIYIHAYNMHGNDLQVVACGLVGWVGMFVI